MCSFSRVTSAGDSKVFLPSGSCSWRAPFPAVRSVLVDPVEQPGARALDLTQAPRYAPVSFCPPLVQHVEEQVAHDGVDLDFQRDDLLLRLNDRKRADNTQSKTKNHSIQSIAEG